MSLSDAAVRHLKGVLGKPDAPGGRYEIRGVVGEGGMGTVYRALDRALDREVALKVLRADLAAPEAEGRLRREARILGRLEHPGIVPVHDVGTLADGRVFYVMKLVRGDRLESYLRSASLTDTLRLFLRVCETVGFAHAHGVVHRDLKPSNIMVGPFGEVLVLDWGIARLIHPEGDSHPTPAEPAVSDGGSDAPATAEDEPDTSPGTVLGTPGFMAPEQAQGWMQLVGPRSDVFALGAILRFLVGGAGAGAPPRSLVSIWSKAMRAEPEGTYVSAAELGAEITRFLDGAPVAAHRESVAERAGRVFRRYQTAIILVLTYLSIRLLFLALRGL
ncbi:MAG: serine/threonine-protein kinase [Gemmatimonadales bacterium]